MDSVKRSTISPKKSRLARTVAKVLHLRAVAGIAPDDSLQKVKSQEKVKNDNNKIGNRTSVTLPQRFKLEDDEEQQNALGLEALLAKLFASVSSVKAAYAQLQCSQSPYDVDGIQTADQLVVSELKNLSELKQCYVKKQFDPSPENAMISAEIQEQKSVSKTYQIMGKKLESQLRLKESEIMYLREKLEEANRQNKVLEKRLNQSGQLSVLDNLHQSSLNPSHFLAVVRFTVKSIRSFVSLLVEKMKEADWDLDAAANSIVPEVIYWRADDKCFAFECFVCRVMFDAFHLPNFSLSKDSLPEKKKQQLHFFRRFIELKSIKAKEYLSERPKSTFARFCLSKYLQLIHPQMEVSLFGNLKQRNLVETGQFPDTSFFISFAEMAKRVWLLHCLAFSFEPAASIFQVRKGCRFSEVYMECVAEEALVSSVHAPESDPPVAFTVVPGFRIGNTIIQCQVYLSQMQTEVKR